ncbi:hypothetical protein ISF6_1565 [Piscinibacter sakaiensis]|uniref:Uncharacterized protein n=1 Tax=Piscinibacter sakaiensis TaxID=1547922 RepID=A0A0K8NZF9_PISS1|nr:hypothetical protein ISF6_1565 [Piscinibacter sakaiensis]
MRWLAGLGLAWRGGSGWSDRDGVGGPLPLHVLRAFGPPPLLTWKGPTHPAAQARLVGARSTSRADSLLVRHRQAPTSDGRAAGVGFRWSSVVLFPAL